MEAVSAITRVREMRTCRADVLHIPVHQVQRQLGLIREMRHRGERDHTEWYGLVTQLEGATATLPCTFDGFVTVTYIGSESFWICPTCASTHEGAA